MLPLLRTAIIITSLGWLSTSWAQAREEPVNDQTALLTSPDPHLAANKRLVYDFWREVFEGLHMERADKYLTAQYIQHNPNVASGRDGFIKAFSKRGQPKPVADRIQAPLISIVAERDRVILVFSRDYPDPDHDGKNYTTTWFDMFRIENGKIAEHWDPALKK